MQRDRIFILVLVGLGIASFFWWLLSPKQEPAPTALSTPTPTQKSNLPPELLPSPSQDVAKQIPGGPYESRDPRWLWWNQMRKEDPEFEWKMPINFYGKVVDQDGRPVSGAKIKFQWNDISATGTSASETTSDGGGLFSLVNVKGKVLGVDVEKGGYYTDRQRSRFDFEYAAFFDKKFYQPDADNPVLFRLKKKGTPEPLITRQTLYGFKIDGTPHYFDLRTGTKRVGGDPTGDIAVRIVRPANHGQHFDWSLVLEGVGGAGLIESSDELAFEAPVEGYEPKLEYEMKADEPGWRAQVQKSFFVRNRDGKLYALLKADVMAIYNEQAAIDVEVYVNPVGSRNLEPGVTAQTSAR